MLSFRMNCFITSRPGLLLGKDVLWLIDLNQFVNTLFYVSHDANINTLQSTLN